MTHIRSNLRRGLVFLATLALSAVALVAWAATVVPTDVQQPGTQPGEASNLELPDKCDNCHGGYNPAVEPAFNWRGSGMANAGRDPLFWATLAVAEQDFDGVGDLCLRCHSPNGWFAKRSVPTDGSALTSQDADGVMCDTCHKMTNPDASEHLGAMKAPFVANDGQTPATGYYGSGMLSLWTGAEKLGPYANADARHQFAQSRFHRANSFCGSCHDVSNPAVGDLAPNHGVPTTADPVAASGKPGSAVDGKAAFNNLPFQYGVVERTFSEFMSGRLSSTRVGDYPVLPAALQAGAIAAAYASAKGDYADGTPRTFSCQTCHLRAVSGPGCNKQGVVIRPDLPLHDMTGGSTLLPDLILFQEKAGTLRLGGGLTATQASALAAGKTRAAEQLALAARLDVSGDAVTVTNLTGHKLITGYPEGRRMWLNVRWFDASDNLLREDGKYGALGVTLDGVSRTVHTLLDLEAPGSRVWEAHYGVTQEWAATLLSLGYPADLPLGFDRISGAVSRTLGELGGAAPGTTEKTFHFVLNNLVLEDNRIPPWEMSYDEARRRNALPVPADQYGAPGPRGTYRNSDTVALSPPVGAQYASLRLLYQSTSWEYVQFLYLANRRTNAFLFNEGVNLLDAWTATGMNQPVVMAAATWGTPPAPACVAPGTPASVTATAGKKSVTLKWAAPASAPSGGHRLYYDQSGKLQLRASIAATATTYKDGGLVARVKYCYVLTAWADCDGDGVYRADRDRESGPGGVVCTTAQ